MTGKMSCWVGLPPGQAARPGVPAAHLAWHIRQGRLLRRGAPPARGGLLGITALEGPVSADTVRQISEECGRWGLSGVFWDLPDSDGVKGSLPGLSRAVGRVGLWQLVPLRLAGCGPLAKVLVPSGVSGGSFRGLMEECAGRLGPARCWLELEQVRSDFCMPAQDADGVRLRQQDLEALVAAHGPGHRCPELQLRYLTYQTGDQTHFLLWDDRETGAEKLRIARELGFSGALIRCSAWEEQTWALLQA